MATINDQIAHIENPELRARIQAELGRMKKQKKFGLVFEEKGYVADYGGLFQ